MNGLTREEKLAKLARLKELRALKQSQVDANKDVRSPEAQAISAPPSKSQIAEQTFSAPFSAALSKLTGGGPLNPLSFAAGALDVPMKHGFVPIAKGAAQVREGLNAPDLGTGLLDVAAGGARMAFPALFPFASLLMGGGTEALSAASPELAEGVQKVLTPVTSLTEPTSRAGRAAAELGDVATIAGIIKGTKPAIRGISKALPAPESIYSKGGGLGSIESLERGAASRGVKERVELGGTYKNMPKNLQKIEQAKAEIFQGPEGVKARVQNLTDSNVKFITKSMADKAFEEVLKQHPLVKGVHKAEYTTKLQEFRDSFVKDNPQTLSPNDILEMKTATHELAPYDKYGTLSNAFDKALARQMRMRLESYDRGLKPLNQRWAELNRLSEAQKEIGQKSGTLSSSPFSSMPFYMAVGSPLRGAVLSETRALAKSPAIRSKLAFTVDWLKNVGKERGAEKIPPMRKIVPSPPPKVEAAFKAEAQRLGITYDGYQAAQGPQFTDRSGGGSSYYLQPGETVEQALIRHRKEFNR